MNTLPEIITSLQRIVEKPKSRCAILGSDGVLDESSLMGTRDGYLHLAITLLQLVAACDGQPTELTDIERLEEERAYWGDSIKNAIHNLPGTHLYIIGCFLFDSHQAFLAALEKEVDPTLSDGARLRNDPSFKDP